MAILTKAQLEELNQSSFPDQSTEAITPAILRTYNTATIDTLVDSLDTGSFIQDLTSLNAFTASQEAKDSTLSAYTASNDTKWSNIASQSGSWGASTDISALNQFTQSQETKNSTLATYTASVDTKFSTIGSQSGSWDNTSLNAFTASQATKNSTLATYTASVDTKFSNIGSQSGSWVTESETGSFARVDVANTFTQTQTINADLIVSGTINAYKINTTIESSSVIYSSGSNILGDAANDTQTLHGSVNVVNQLTASGLHYPTTDGIFTGQVLQTNAAGTLSFGNVNAVFETVHNGEATTLTVGTPLYVSGALGSNPIVYRADATNPAKMPVTFVAMESIASGQNGRGITLGLITGINMTGFNVGEDLWVDGIGQLTNVRPTGSNDIIQPIGIVTKTGAGGQLNVLNPGPVLLPNIQTGYAWVGNASNQPVSVPTSSFAGTPINTGSFATTGSNVFDGAQTILNGGINLQANIEGSGSAYTGITAVIDTTTDPSNVYSAYQLIKPGGDNLISIAVNSYTAEYPNTPIPYLFGGGNNPDGTNAGIAFPANGEADHWKKSNFKYGISVTGSTELQSFTSSLQQGYAFVGGANGKTTTVPTSSFGGGSTINTGSFATTGSNNFVGNQTISNGSTLNVEGKITGNGGLDLLSPFTSITMAANAQSSGSAYTGINTFVDVNSDPTNVYSAFQLIDASNQNTLIAIAANSYTPQYPGVTIPMLFGGGNNPDGNSAGITFPTDGTAEVWKKSNFKYGVDVTGSLKVTSTLTASLQQGYAWVGGSGNKTIAVPTSSFSGGGGGFPYSGTASISGSLQVTGSMSGLVTELTVSSNTASVDFTKGNFFSITLPGGATTHFVVSNSIKGQTVNIQINQPAGASTGSVAFAPSILFAGGNDYQATATGSAIDLLTMVAITGSSVLATSIKNFQ
jgi:hypothetical protein